MTDPGLSDREPALIRAVFRRFPAIREAVLFGSRAKGSHTARSDIDLALIGLDDALRAEAVAQELDDLPLPYRFAVKACEDIRYAPLRAPIERGGVLLYRKDDPEGKPDGRRAHSR